MSGRFDSIALQLLREVSAPAKAQTDLRGLVSTGGGAKWRGGLSALARPVLIDHYRARQSARGAMQDSVQARAVVERTADTVADGGLRVEFAPVVEVLGITREYAAEWARNTAARFDLWAKDKNQHRAGLYNFYQSQPMWQLFRHRDNDQFVRLFYESDPTLQNPLQFDFLDPDQVRGDALTTSTAFQSGNDGIKRDTRGREVGYSVWVRQDDNTYKEVDLPAQYPGGRKAMLHGFTSEYAGQGRGYSRLAHAVQEFEKITDFSASVLQRAINQANIYAFVKPSDEEDASSPFEDIIASQTAGPAATLFGSNPQPVEGVPVVPDKTPGLDRFYQVPEVALDTPGGLFIANLRKGSDIAFPALTAPGDTYDRFVDAFATHIAASLKIPLEVVLMKFGQNYSASRATLLLFWRVCCIERQEMANDYLNPIVEMWLAGEIAAGRIVAPGWSDPRMRAAWLNCTWIGSSAPDIDPAKSAKAARENIEIGRTNAEREARDYNGTSAADNIAANKATYSDKWVPPWNEPGNPPPGTAAPAPTPAKALLEEFRAVLREELDL